MPVFTVFGSSPVQICTCILAMYISYVTFAHYILCSGRYSVNLSHVVACIMAIPVIGGSGGGVFGTHPQWDPILLFSHTFSPKSAHVRGPCPPPMGACPPYGKSWICHCQCQFHPKLGLRFYTKVCRHIFSTGILAVNNLPTWQIQGVWYIISYLYGSDCMFSMSN